MGEEGTGSLPRLPLPREQECPFDPVPDYARLRAEAPVTRVACPTGITAWLVSSYAEVREVLGDPERFSTRAGGSAHVLAHMDPEAPLDEGQFPRMDGAEHRRFRRNLGPEISMIKRIEQLAPIVQNAVDERIDQFVTKGAPADLYGDFAKPVTTAVIAELLGVPSSEHELFQNAAEKLFNTTTDAEQLAAAIGPLFAYTQGLVGRRRAEPGDDVLSRMVVRGDNSDRPFTDVELCVMAAALLIAGYDTTASMISYGMLMLLEHPGQLARLREDPGLVPGAVEEVVRFLAVGMGIMRVATTDTELAGQSIAAGDYLVLALQSANRDTALYADGDRLDVTREPGPHLGFGHGPHQCVGQQLARLELRTVLSTLPRRIPSLRLAVPLSQIEFKTENPVTGPVAVPVTWDEVR